MSETKNFHIGDILSAMTGRLVSPRHIGGIYDILNWMTGESLMTHQLPRASRESEGSLRNQFPDLAEIVVPKDIHTEEAVLFWLESLRDQYGSHRDVAPLQELDHTHIDPITELLMMAPNAQIIPVVVPD